MCRTIRIAVALPSLVLTLFTLTACGGGSHSSAANAFHQFTHVYVVAPPVSGINNQHLMASVMNQAAIEGVTVDISWLDAETGTPGPNTCAPSSSNADTCQMDASGWTHTYDWTTIDNANAQWFAVPGNKKVNIILDGIGSGGALAVCLYFNNCVNPITPYYVTTSSWAAQTGSTTQDVINGNKDGCTNDVGLIATSMTRDASGLVAVAMPNTYKNGDLIWIGSTSASNFDISQESITAVQVAGNVLTITAANSLPVGSQVTFENLGAATFLDQQTVTVLTSTPTQFTASLTNSNYGPTAETAGTANPLGVPVQNATSSSFQYQSGIASAGASSVQQTVISAQQSYPVPYETPYVTAFEPFVAAAIAHFNASPNFSQISYMRVGRSVGGEAYPYCVSNMENLPAPNTYSKAGWLQYYTDIDQFVQSQGPKMQIIDPLNESGSGASADTSYGSSEASIAVTYKNAAGATNGVGSQGLQASDITSYNENSQCTSDWCGVFNSDFQLGIPLELQQASLSAPVAISGTDSATGDLRSLLPFAVDRGMTIFELYALDALLAYDPNYCVLVSSSPGTCNPSSSVSIPTIQLPAGDQYAYFQAVGQSTQTGSTGDGSYAATINSTQGQH
ncbi:MAG: hypothetical protein WBX38_19190 [Candidatus Sulfotelmatobacter sp.]